MHMVEGTSSSDGSMSGTVPTKSYVGLGAKVYLDLVKAFCKVDRKAFQKIVQEHETLLSNDGNTGMVAQCESELVRRQVYQLSRMYSVISLEQLSSTLELPAEQVQTLLLQLSIQKMWGVQVEDGMVVFPRLTKGRSAEDEKDLEDLVQLTKTLQKLDVNIAASSKYHAFVRREGSAKNSDKSGPRGVEDV
jgi:hypothetical protein